MVWWYDERMHRWTAFCFVIWKTGYFFFICENGSFAKWRAKDKGQKKNSCRNSMFHIPIGINGNLMTLIDYVHWRWCISFAFSFHLSSHGKHRWQNMNFFLNFSRFNISSKCISRFIRMDFLHLVEMILLRKKKCLSSSHPPAIRS